MRFKTAALIVTPVLLFVAACSSTTPPRPDGDFSYLRTPTTFRSFAAADRSYRTAYTAPAGWTEQSSRNSFTYWNAVMAVRTGNRCFAIEDLKVSRTEEIGTSGLEAGAPAGPTTPGAPLATRPPVPYYQFTAITKLDPECTLPGAVDARDYLSRTSQPDRPPRP